MKGLMRKVRRDEGGFTLIELLIVIIILGVLAAVVAFNVGGFLGQGTLQTAKTEAASVQTALMAGMAARSAGGISSPLGLTNTDKNVPVTCTNGANFTLDDYLHLPTHGNWTWGPDGVITNGNYAGGGRTCTYDVNDTADTDGDGDPKWDCA